MLRQSHGTHGEARPQHVFDLAVIILRRFQDGVPIGMGVNQLEESHLPIGVQGERHLQVLTKRRPRRGHTGFQGMGASIAAVKVQDKIVSIFPRFTHTVGRLAWESTNGTWVRDLAS